MRAITEGQSRNEEYSQEKNHCGRCGVAIRGSEFCSACRKFFQMLTVGKEVIINFKSRGNGKLRELND